MPFYPEPEQEKRLYDIETFWEKFTADYMGVSLPEVQELDLVEFMAIRRDAFIHELSKTKEGRDYLQRAWEYEQTEPDYEGLRELQKMIGGGR